MITQQTAYDIWIAYEEIAKGEKLIRDMQKAMKEGEHPTPRDAFGRRRNLQLGVPSGEDAHQLFDVQPRLAIAIITAHIAEKKSVLAAANERARHECGVGIDADRRSGTNAHTRGEGLTHYAQANIGTRPHRRHRPGVAAHRHEQGVQTRRAGPARPARAR